MKRRILIFRIMILLVSMEGFLCSISDYKYQLQNFLFLLKLLIYNYVIPFCPTFTKCAPQYCVVVTMIRPMSIMPCTANSTKNHFLLLLGVSLYGHVVSTLIPALLAKLDKNLPPHGSNLVVLSWGI